MEFIELCELLSYVVTIIGFPFAIIVFIYEKHLERQGEEEEIYQKLSDEYAGFLELVLKNSDLQLRSLNKSPDLNDEQRERKFILFEILISLFERAYLLVYEEHMSKQTQRLWRSWQDYMTEWCRREDFRQLLPRLLEGEDPDFIAYIKEVSRKVEQKEVEQ